METKAQADKSALEVLVATTLPAHQAQVQSGITQATTLCASATSLFTVPTTLFLQQKTHIRKAKRDNFIQIQHPELKNSYKGVSHFQADLAHKTQAVVANMAELMTTADANTICASLQTNLASLDGFLTFAINEIQTVWLNTFIPARLTAVAAKATECNNTGGGGGGGGGGNTGGNVDNVVPGKYTVKSTRWNKFLANYRNDNLAGIDLEDVWEVKDEGNSQFSLQSTTTNNYLRMGRNDEVNTVGWRRSWELWTLEKDANGAWCIKNVQWGKYVRMYKSGDDFLVNQGDTCGTHEANHFVSVNYTSKIYENPLDGLYTIKHKVLGRFLSNIKDDDLLGTQLEDVWTITHEGAGIYSVQSTTTNNYLRGGRPLNQINSVAHNRGWEKWFIYEAETGIYCLENNQWEKYPNMAAGTFAIGANTMCGDNEHWQLTKVTYTSKLYADALNGKYTIKSQSLGAYLVNARNSDISGLNRFDVWTITHLGYGVYNLQSETTSNYLSMHRNGVRSRATAHKWEKFHLQRESPTSNVYCIYNYKWSSYIKMFQSGSQYPVVKQSACGSSEKFIFEATNATSQVWTNALSGTFTIKGQALNKFLANIRDDELAAWPREDVWTVAHHGFGIYSLQSTLTSKYLRMGRSEINTIDWDRSWEKWFIIDNGDGTHCLQNQKWGLYLRLFESSTENTAIQAAGCGASEKLIFTATTGTTQVWANAPHGVYTIKNNADNLYLNNYDNDNLKGDVAQNWNIVHDGFGLFSLQNAVTNYYLRMGRCEVNTITWNRGWEKWYLEEVNAGSGIYCLLNKKWNKTIKVTAAGVTRESGCGTAEQLVFTKVV
jgi:hypothetical protein